MAFEAIEQMGLVAPQEGRVAPWAMLSKKKVADISKARNANEGLHLAGLDFEVIQRRSFYEYEGAVYDDGVTVNVRATDGAMLGKVGDDYTLLQNSEAFSIADEVMEFTGGSFLNAGTFDGGRKVFMTIERGETQIMGDLFSRYFVLVNSFNASTSFMLLLTHIRIFCQNTLNAAIRGAERCIRVQHRGDLAEKMENVRRVLYASVEYDEAFRKDAEHLAKIRISREGINRVLNAVFPLDEVDPVAQERKFNNLLKVRDNFVACLNKADLYDHRNNAWGIYNAMADAVYHGGTVLQKTAKTEERPMMDMVSGSALLDKVHTLLLASA